MNDEPDFIEGDADDTETVIAAISYELESVITDLDKESKAAGFVLNDSNARSVLIKLIRKTEGRPGKPAPAPKERTKDFWIAMLHEKLNDRLEAMAAKSARDMNDEPMKFADWRSFLLILKESLETRSSREPGSRDYLDFLEEFIADARKQGMGSLLDVNLRED